MCVISINGMSVVLYEMSNVELIQRLKISSYRNPDGPAVTSPEVSLPLVTGVDDDLVKGRQSALVLPFADLACCSSQLVGGKGAQLAQLTKIQEMVSRNQTYELCSNLLYILNDFFC